MFNKRKKDKKKVKTKRIESERTIKNKDQSLFFGVGERNER